MRIDCVPGVKCFVRIKMCYMYNQWYDILCATLYIDITDCKSSLKLHEMEYNLQFFQINIKSQIK